MIITLIFVLVAILVIFFTIIGIKKSDGSKFDIIAYSALGIGLLTGLFLIWFITMFAIGYGV